MAITDNQAARLNKALPIAADIDLGGIIKTLQAGIGKRRSAAFRPPGFSNGWVPPINIYRDEFNTIYTDFDVAAYQPTGKTYYVDGTSGLDTNNGLTLATAFKTIKKAVDLADVVVVLVAEGIYDRVGAFSGTAVTKSGALAIKAIPGHRVRVLNCSPQAWTFHNQATYPNLYKSSVTGGKQVFDDKYHDALDDMLEYIPVGTAAECDSIPGSCFISGATTYIHTIDGRTPDASIFAMKDQLSAQFNDGTFYFEGISFEGGNTGACMINKVNTAPKPYFKNCKFKYALNDAGSPGGLSVVGASEAFLQNCEAARNINDGFNYHVKLGTIANVIEVNCVGRHNGTVGDIDNGSTQHDGGKIVRVNCEYFGNSGSNVGDNSPGTQSWNLGVYSHSSAAVLITAYKSNFTAHPDSEMWIDSCISDGSYNAFTVQAGATMHVHNCDLTAGFTVEEGGTLVEY